MRWCAPLVALLGLAVAAGAADELAGAIRAGDLAKVEALVAADPGLACRPTEFSGLPLHLAVEQFRPEIVRCLLDRGADVNAVDAQGEGAVFRLMAVPVRSERRFGQIRDLLQLLCALRAEVGRPNRHGETPLYRLAGRQFGKTTQPFKMELLRLLVANGADPGAPDRADPPLLLHVLGEIRRDELARANLVETVAFLVEHGAAVDAADRESGDTPLLRVIKAKTLSLPDQAALVELLVGHGASIRRKNRAKESPERLVGRDHPLHDALHRRAAR